MGLVEIELAVLNGNVDVAQVGDDLRPAAVLQVEVRDGQTRDGMMVAVGHDRVDPDVIDAAAEDGLARLRCLSCRGRNHRQGHADKTYSAEDTQHGTSPRPPAAEFAW